MRARNANGGCSDKSAADHLDVLRKQYDQLEKRCKRALEHLKYDANHNNRVMSVLGKNKCRQVHMDRIKRKIILFEQQSAERYNCFSTKEALKLLGQTFSLQKNFRYNSMVSVPVGSKGEIADKKPVQGGWQLVIVLEHQKGFWFGIGRHRYPISRKQFKECIQISLTD